MNGGKKKKQFPVCGGGGDGDVVDIQDIHKTGCYSKIGGGTQRYLTRTKFWP